MTRAIVFGEDYAHEVVLRTLLERLAIEYSFPLEIQIRSAVGGHGRMVQELKDFLSELRGKPGQTPLPDLFVVARVLRDLRAAFQKWTSK